MAFKVIVTRVDDGQRCNVVRSNNMLTIVIPNSSVNEDTIRKILEICEDAQGNGGGNYLAPSIGITLNEVVDLVYSDVFPS